MNRVSNTLVTALRGVKRLVPPAAVCVAGGAGAWCAVRGGGMVWGAVGCAAALGLALMPSIVVLTVFALFMGFSHQFRSWAVFPLGGIEWHPREVLLFLLFEHAGIQAVRGRFEARLSATHFFVYMFALFYALAAAVGVFQGQPLSGIVSELRNGMFIAAFFVFAACLPARCDAMRLAGALLAAAALTAAGAIAFFLYTALTGHIVNEQNAFGEFVPRLFPPVIVQSVRPNGHAFFEVCLVVLTSLLFAPAPPGRCRPLRRMGIVALMLLFSVAILLTMMRTAYVVVAVSWLALGALCLPRKVQGYLAAGLCCAGVLAAALLAANVREIVAQGLPAVEASLKGRLVEVSGAWEAFLEHPLFGNGLGATFTAMGYVAKKTQETIHASEYQLLHNVWMYYLFKGGLAGLLLTLGGLLGIFARGYAAFEARGEGWERFFLRGVLAAYAGQLVAAFSMPRLIYPQGVALVALAAYFAVVFERRDTAPFSPMPEDEQVERNAE